MTAPTTPPPSPLERLRQLAAAASLPTTVTIDDVSVAVAIAPAIRILEALEQHPEIRPASWVRSRVGHLSDVVNDVARQLRAIAGDSRYAGAFEVRTLVDRFTWCGEQLKLLTVESWHERPAPRVPVAVAVIPRDAGIGGFDRTVALCADGTYWIDDEAGRWEELSPIPDSIDDRRRRDEQLAESSRVAHIAGGGE